jgi:hypothetical protein
MKLHNNFDFSTLGKQFESLENSLFRLMGRRVVGPTGIQFSRTRIARIGANDARHREHLMAPARQLTSSASLKSKGCREIRLLLK